MNALDFIQYRVVGSKDKPLSGPTTILHYSGLASEMQEDIEFGKNDVRDAIACSGDVEVAAERYGVTQAEILEWIRTAYVPTRFVTLVSDYSCFEVEDLQSGPWWEHEFFEIPVVLAEQLSRI